jgi:hypothetical protein
MRGELQTPPFLFIADVPYKKDGFVALTPEFVSSFS